MILKWIVSAGKQHLDLSTRKKQVPHRLCKCAQARERGSGRFIAWPEEGRREWPTTHLLPRSADKGQKLWERVRSDSMLSGYNFNLVSSTCSPSCYHKRLITDSTGLSHSPQLVRRWCHFAAERKAPRCEDSKDDGARQLELSNSLSGQYKKMHSRWLPRTWVRSEAGHNRTSGLEKSCLELMSDVQIVRKRQQN